MSFRTIYLSRLIGLFCVIFAVGELLHRAAMVHSSTELVGGAGLLLLSGMATLLAGLAIVLGHNVWTGGGVQVVVTVVGWLLLIKGIGLVMITPGAAVGLLEAVRYQDFYYFYDLIALLLGVYLTWAGFSAPLPERGR